MKKAFTMIELVIAIVIIGILSTIAIQKLHTNTLTSAAKSVINDLRYLQYLALNNDIYDGSKTYTSKRWQFKQHCVANEISSGKPVCKTNPNQGYTIFSDKAGGSTGNPDESELVTDYLESDKYLGAKYSGIVITKKDFPNRTDVTKTFGIKDIKIFYIKKDGRFGSTSKIYFNELGEANVDENFARYSTVILRLQKNPGRVTTPSNSICIVIDGKSGFISVPDWSSSSQVVEYKDENGIAGKKKECSKIIDN